MRTLRSSLKPMSRKGYCDEESTLFEILIMVLAMVFVGLMPGGGMALDVTTNTRPWLEEAEFGQDPLLHATANQTVVLDLESRGDDTGDTGDFFSPRGGWGPIRDNRFRFLVEEPQKFSFCIPEDEPSIVLLTVKENRDGWFHRGSIVVRSRPGGPCEPVSLAPGSYTVDVYHDSRTVPPGGKKAFLHRPQQARLLGSSQNDFTSAAWFTFKGPNGKFVGLSGSLKSTVTAVAPLELWLLAPDSTMRNQGNGSTVAALDHGGIEPLVTVPYTDYPGYYIQQFHVTDLGSGQFTLTTSDPLGQGAVNLGGSDPTELVRNFVDTTPTTFTVDFKAFQCDTCDSATLPLQEGEVALFAGCDYKGPAFVFQADAPDLSVYNNAAPEFAIGDNMVSSVRLGPNALAVLFEDAQFGGTALGIREDTPCLDATPLGNGAASSVLVTTDIKRFVVASDACENCNLTGIDLSNEDLTAGMFSETIFSEANLTNTIFKEAKLDHATLSQATLSGTDFTGAVLNCTDLSETDLSTVALDYDPTITTDFSCRLNLSGTRLPIDALSFSSWRYLNLTDATILGGEGATLSTLADPLDLSGAILSGVTGLSGVILDGADLGCATPAAAEKNCTQLIDTDLSKASLIQANLADAAMNGATLNQANLEKADLSGAQLSKSPNTGFSAKLNGAYLKNANLAQANLGGATLKNANWYSSFEGVCSNWIGTCASGEGANLSNADLEGAYLNGLDLSGATLQGANLAGALLIGANFTQANLSGDTTIGASMYLTGAFLQGVDFTDTVSTDGADFTSAYVDLTTPNGQTMVFQLPADNLGFTGYGKDPDEPECVYFSYTTQFKTLVPVTTSLTTCPDGNGGACTDTRWQTPTTPIDQAQPPSSNSLSPAGTCTTIDFDW